MLAITGGTIIDGNGGRPIEGGVLVVEDGRIRAIEHHSTELPSCATRIDAAGKYVIPGLMDANVHLVLDYFPLTLIRYEGRYDELAIEAAQVALRNGVTTVFDTWGPRQYLAKAREAVRSGSVSAARIYFAGNIIGLGGPFSDDFCPKGREVLPESFVGEVNALWEDNVGPGLIWMSPEQVRREVREYAQQGADFLKFAITTHRGEMQHLQFSPRVQRVIVEEAHRAGLTVQTHTTTNEALDLAMGANVDLMQHVDLTYGPEALPAETIALMAERGIPGALLPQTAKALAWYAEHASNTSFLKRYATMEANVHALLRAGVVLLLSTDGGLVSRETRRSSAWSSWVPPEESLLELGEGHFHWLLAVQQKGMKPMHALMAATRNIARAYKVDEHLGTLEAGKIADLVILDKNPLEDATHYRSIHLVMKEGAVVDRERLPSRPLLTGSPSAS